MLLKITMSCAALLVGATANAAVVTLDFEGLADNESVGNFYNGGGGSDFDVSFSQNALAVIDLDAGGTGNFANEPTPDTILVFLTGSAATLNALNGFEDGFSFFYTSTNFVGSIGVYDGLDATGSLLATLPLPMTAEGPGDPNGGTGDPRGSFGTFVPIGVSFDGTARSIDFGGTINQIGFDNITFGSATPGDGGGVEPNPNVIPLPATLPLLAGGLVAGFAALRRRRW
jgi:hypothetical protein